MCIKSVTLKTVLYVSFAGALAACGESQNTAVDVPEIVENASYTQDFVTFAENSANGDAEPCEMTQLDVALLEEINNARANARMCGSDFKEAVEPLAWSCKLKEAGLMHSTDMGTYDFFSHTGSDGLNVGHRTDQANYRWSRVGENIAAGFDTVQSAVQGWIDSPSHCSTLMSPNYDDLGVGFHFAADTEYGTYWTMVVGKEARF